jgi:iron complex outermembrane receptor protein
MVRTAWLAGTAFALIATQASAQDAAASSSSPEIVVTGQQARSDVATKTDTPLLETPQSASVVSAERYFAQGSLTLSDAVRYVVGARADTYGDDNRSDDTIVRGLPALLYQDGLRRTFGGYRQGSRPDIFLLDSVTVLRGPSSMLYGQNGTGGLVDIASKRAGFTPGAQMFGSYGSFDRKEIGVDLNEPLVSDRLAGRITALWRQGDTQTRDTKDRRWAVQPSVTWKPGADTEITLLGLYQDDDGGVTDQFLPYAITLRRGLNGRIPNSANLGEPSVDHIDFTTKNVTLLARHRFSDAIQLKAGVRHEWFTSDQRIDYQDGFADPNDPFVDPADPYLNRYFPALAAAGPGRILNRVSFAEHFRSRTLTGDANLQADFRTGPFTHKLLVGIDYARFRGSLASAFGSSTNADLAVAPTATPIDAFDPQYGNIIPLTLGEASVSREEQIGVYAQDQVTAFEKLHIVGGVRRDRARASGDGIATQVDHATTFRGAVLYDVAPGVVPYFNYSESFLPVAGTDFFGNAYHPTRGRQYEAGVKWQPDAHTLLTVAGFDLKDSGRLVTDAANPFNSVQAGTVKSRGIELEASRALGFGFDLVANYSYTRVRDSSIETGGGVTTDQFVSVPKHQASTFVVKGLELGDAVRMRIGGGARYIGPSYSVGQDAAGDPATLRTPGYLLFDALLSLERGRIKAALNATNLADKRYFGTCVGTGYCFVGVRRRITFSLGYSL